MTIVMEWNIYINMQFDPEITVQTLRISIGYTCNHLLHTNI